MNKKIEKRESNKILDNKKTIPKSWEDELSEWMIEEFFTPFQAS